MNTSTKYFLPFIVVAIAASLSSCNSPSTPDNITSATPAPTTIPTPSQTPTMAQLRAKPNNIEPPENTPIATAKTTNVTLYTSDVQCQELIPQKVSVPAAEPVTGAVSKIIEEQNTADLSLSGYRVKVENGIATVDLRLSPESKRQLVSLSSCEQFALFGSLRKTLTSNAQWNIKEVRFTEQGKEVVR
ncbi:GerMN domain-containing protein [Halotia branconii]|uniref:GerMN domain-containing protein n=1 Tax=Halotia branconii CENA392 TaxID=1539056 RepID=A0AAJ6P8X2_9CYAN|nr:GerMN domain-containing protein [Halotia branconii]WGV25140.1 GerMN domain-containing protein [Halotia branconii CENA392]